MADDDEMQPITEPRIDVMETAQNDCCSNRYPRAIVWGPLPPLTCCGCPCVGHMGIGDSEGKIHDFAGPYYVGVDQFMVGPVWRYATIRPKNGPTDEEWDIAIDEADAQYQQRMHNICCDNCHHHTAFALEKSGLPQWGCGGLLSAWIYCALHGRCTWWDGVLPC